MHGLFAEARAFILRGNVLDLAVGIVIGAAFAAVAESLVSDLITPLLAIPGSTSFQDLQVVVNDSEFRYGRFINSLLTLLLSGSFLFFVVVVPANALVDRARRRGSLAEPKDRACPECLNLIPVAARRCGFCTSDVEPLPLSS